MEFNDYMRVTVLRYNIINDNLLLDTFSTSSEGLFTEDNQLVIIDRKNSLTKLSQVKYPIIFISNIKILICRENILLQRKSKIFI